MNTDPDQDPTAPPTGPSDSGPIDDLSGHEMGDYRVLRRLGRGGMADVYLAEQRSLRRQVAIKILRQDLASDATYVQRFHNEAMAAAALVHANIVQIHEVGEFDGLHFIAQEYVPGNNLGELIRQKGTPDIKLAVAIIRQVAAALAKADQHGIVHRDIKPENIMLARTGEVKVADFGLARFREEGTDLTQVGITMGTPLYMSPEQIEGRRLDARSDIYSLGVTCFHMLAGRPPFEGDSALAVAVQHLNNPPDRLDNLRPDLPGSLTRIVHQMLNKKPEDRYENAKQLLQELRGLAIAGAEDWADGLDEWSDAELIAMSEARTAATQRLDTVMATSAQLHPSRPLWQVLAAGTLACTLVGVLLAAFSRPTFLLRGAKAPEIGKRDDVWSQLYQAKMTNTEASWQSVLQYFGDAKFEFQQNLAKQGLVRYYMVQPDYDQALKLLEELTHAPDHMPQIQAFGWAGQVVVLSLMEKAQPAQDAFAQLMTNDLHPHLDDNMRRQLGRVVGTYHREMDAKLQGLYQQLVEDDVDEDEE